jgi:hypothetical protein
MADVDQTSAPSARARTPSFGLQIALFYRIITNCSQQGPLIRMHYRRVSIRNTPADISFS